MMTLISPNRGRDGSSIFAFNFSSLWSLPKKCLNFPCLIRFSICCFKSKHSSVSYPWSLWKRQYLFLLRLLGFPFNLLWPFQGRIVLDLHEYLIEWGIQGRIILIPCWGACLSTIPVFLIFRLSLLWTRTLFRVTCRIGFHPLSSLPLFGYNCVFCIHEVLGRMDEFGHGLRLLLI